MTVSSEAPRAQSGSVVWLGLTRLVYALAGVVLTLVLARYLGDDDYGAYTILVTAASLMGFLAHLNLEVLLAREVAKAPAEARSWLGDGLGIMAITVLPAVGLVVAYVALVDGRPDLWLAAALAGLAMALLGVSTVVQAVLQGLRRMRAFPVATFAGRVVMVGGTILLLVLDAGLVGVFLAQVLAYAITTVILMVALVSSVGPPVFRGLRAMLSSARAAIPFGLSRLYGMIYLSSDVLVVGFFHPDAEAAVYGIASLALVQLAVLSSVFVGAIYPALSRDAGDRDKVGSHVQFALRLLLLAGVPLSLGGMLVAHDLVLLAFGEDFIRAAPAMMILLPVLCLRYVTHLSGSVLSACDRQPERTRTVFVAAILNLVANLAVVPFYGAIGAACTTLATELLLAVWLAALIAREVRGVRLTGTLLRLAGCAVLMAAVVVGLHYLPFEHVAFVLVQVVAGGLTFVGASYALRIWSRADLGRMRRL